MKTTKFYALLTGNKTELQRQMERTFDKKANKFFNRVVEQEVSRPKTVLVTLNDARNRAEAQQDAQAISASTGMKLQGVHAFK